MDGGGLWWPVAARASGGEGWFQEKAGRDRSHPMGCMPNAKAPDLVPAGRLQTHRCEQLTPQALPCVRVRVLGDTCTGGEWLQRVRPCELGSRAEARDAGGMGGAMPFLTKSTRLMRQSWGSSCIWKNIWRMLEMLMQARTALGHRRWADYPGDLQSSQPPVPARPMPPLLLTLGR